MIIKVVPCVHQSCDVGYRRSPGGRYFGTCESCFCHGHSTECDSTTGQCLVCSLTFSQFWYHIERSCLCRKFCWLVWQTGLFCSAFWRLLWLLSCSMLFIPECHTETARINHCKEFCAIHSVTTIGKLWNIQCWFAVYNLQYIRPVTSLRIALVRFLSCPGDYR